jgi:hypothetical protein
LAVDMPMLAQPLAECVEEVLVGRWRLGAHECHAGPGGRVLRLGSARRGEGAGPRGQQEAAAIHHSII